MKNILNKFNNKLFSKKKRNSSLKSKFKTFLKKIKKLNFFEKDFIYFYKLYLNVLNKNSFKNVIKKKKIFRLISNSNNFLKKKFFENIL